MTSIKSTENSGQTVTFDIFYDFWRLKFTKKSDPLVLFFHYLLVRNEFKAMHVQNGQINQMMPEDWLRADGYTQIVYLKEKETYKLEAFEIKENLNMIFRNISGGDDKSRFEEKSVLELPISKYIQENYQADDYTKVLKGGSFISLYSSMQVFINKVQKIDGLQLVKLFSDRSSKTKNSTKSATKTSSQAMYCGNVDFKPVELSSARPADANPRKNPCIKIEMKEYTTADQLKESKKCNIMCNPINAVIKNESQKSPAKRLRIVSAADEQDHCPAVKKIKTEL